jgi:AbrB family looped-hinge helix DNA binding protein
MPLVKVKDKFQVTIPSRVREQLPLAVGDVLEATVEQGVIVLRPKAVVDRDALARRVERVLADAVPSPEDTARSEDELTAAAVDEVAAVRAARRSGRR